MKQDVEKLLVVWDRAIQEWRGDKGLYRMQAAEKAISYGAYFESTVQQHDLLQEIAWNFSTLALPGDDDSDPDNEKLWAHQAELIAQVHRQFIKGAFDKS